MRIKCIIIKACIITVFIFATLKTNKKVTFTTVEKLEVNDVSIFAFIFNHCHGKLNK